MPSVQPPQSRPERPSSQAVVLPYISVIVPVFNEVENLRLLYDELQEVLEHQGRAWEVIFIDDGSTDGTRDVLRQLSQSDAHVCTVVFRRNFGQTAALSAGFDQARGQVMVPMDGDLQNDPRDIPRLLKLVEQGYDVVSGWRRRRSEPFLPRRLPSLVANWFIGRLSKVRIHDYGCTLKASLASGTS